jgi:hypothetical protein
MTEFLNFCQDEIKEPIFLGIMLKNDDASVE